MTPGKAEAGRKHPALPVMVAPAPPTPMPELHQARVAMAPAPQAMPQVELAARPPTAALPAEVRRMVPTLQVTAVTAAMEPAELAEQAVLPTRLLAVPVVQVLVAMAEREVPTAYLPEPSAWPTA